MNIENEIFKKYAADFSKLKSFGFIDLGEYYLYSKNILDDAFNLQIKVYKSNKIEMKVIDNEFNEEYSPLNIDSFAGSFVENVRNNVKNELIIIRDFCFVKQLFVAEQSNRIAKLIYDRFGEIPDYPFKKLENYGVFRYHKTKKWYGLIMNIPKNKLTKNPSDVEEIDIINLKIDPNKRDEIMKIDGVYECYHMNKKSWISIILDGSIGDDLILKFIEESRNLIINNK